MPESGVVLCGKSESKYDAVMKREGSNMLADIYIPHRRCFQIHIDLLSLGGVQADSLSRTPKNKLLNEKANRNIDPGPSLTFMFECTVESSIKCEMYCSYRRLRFLVYKRQMEMTERYF